MQGIIHKKVGCTNCGMRIDPRRMLRPDCGLRMPNSKLRTA